MSHTRMPGRRQTAVVAAPFVLVALANLAGWSFSAGWRRRYDLSIYLQAARAHLDGGSLYDFSTERGLGFTYPPVSVLPFLPISSLRLELVWVCWVLAIAAVIGWCAACWFRAVAPRATYLPLLLAAGALAVTDPVNDSMWLGQLSPFVGAMGVAAVVGSPALSGAWAGLGAALKLTPIATLAAFVVQPDRWRRTGWSMAALGVLTTVGFLAAPADSRRYWTSELWDTRRVGSVDTASNTSLAGLFAHAGVGDGPAVVLGAGMAATLALLWWARVRGRAIERFDLAVVVGAVTVLAVPVSWSHHALAVCLGWALLGLRRRWGPAVVGTLVWTVPLFDWAGHAVGPAQLAVQAVRPLSVVWLVWLLAAVPRRAGPLARVAPTRVR